MSNPQPTTLKPRPPRAAPLQPDRPSGTGDAPTPPEASPEALDEAAVARLREQAETALQNTRDGYR